MKTKAADAEARDSKKKGVEGVENSVGRLLT